MKELLEIAGVAQNSGGLMMLLVVIWVDMRYLKASVIEVKQGLERHEEKYVHMERRGLP